MGRSVQAESSSDPEVTMWTSGLGSHMDTCAHWHPTPQLPFGMVHLPWSQIVIKSHGLNLHCMPGTMPSTLHTLPVSIRVQPVAQHKIINLLKTLWIFFLWLCVAMHVMCGPRQLFFFQSGPETPKGWTPLFVNAHSNTTGKVLSLPSFSQLRNWGIKKLHNLPKVVQFFSCSVKMWTQTSPEGTQENGTVWPLSPARLPICSFCFNFC